MTSIIQMVSNGQFKSNLICQVGLLAFVTMLSACSTYSKDQCHNLSWHHLGYEQGHRGNPNIQSVYDKYAKTCGRDHNIYPNAAEMEKGYAEGLKSYCTEEGGLRAGSSGLTYSNVCSPKTAPSFMKTYQPARFNWLETEHVRLKKENEELKSKNDRLDDEVDELKSKVSNLESDKRKLEDELRSEKNKRSYDR